jgi:hypothetical protein
MSCTYNCNNSANNSIFKLGNILEAIRLKMSAASILKKESIFIELVSVIGNEHLWLLWCIQDMFDSVSTQQNKLFRNSMQHPQDRRFYACAGAESFHRLK